MASSLELKTRTDYWRSLTRLSCPDPRLYPGMVEELQAALRDAIHTIDDTRSPSLSTPTTYGRWRGEWIGKC